MDVLLVAATSLVSCTVSALVGSLVAIAKSKGKGAAEDAKTLHELAENAAKIQQAAEIIEPAVMNALVDGVRSLLWRELYTIYEKALESGGISAADLKHENKVYSAYHGLGGNGSGTRIHELINSMEVLCDG